MTSKARDSRREASGWLSLAERALESAVEGAWRTGEVYLKDAHSVRCEFGPLAVRAVAVREERGIAIRIWDARGREGFVHADGFDARDLGELGRRARSSAHDHPGGDVPRLPAGGGSRLGPSFSRAEFPLNEQGLHAETIRVRDAAERLIAASSAPGLEATTLTHGWVETGRAEITIVNTLGLRAAMESQGVTAGVTVGGSGVGAPGDGGVAAVRYTLAAERLADLDPGYLLREASWRAASAIGGSSMSAKRAVVVLEPRAAAVWIRSLIPGFTRATREDRPPNDSRSLGSLSLFDDPACFGEGGSGVRFDGEGRPLSLRHLLTEGVLTGRILDSHDPEAAEGELGPMRRDSFRDTPAPGPVHLRVPAGSRTRDEILRSISQGLFVTSLITHSAAGSDSFIAQARGVWVEDGLARHAVARTVLILPAIGSASRVVERGSDPETDPAGPPVTTPSLVLEGATLLPM